MHDTGTRFRPRLAHLVVSALLAVSALVTPSCSGYGIGTGCSSQDQCSGDLQCIVFCGVTNDGRICSHPCQTDADCADLGDDIICFSCADNKSVCFPNDACGGGSTCK